MDSGLNREALDATLNKLTHLLVKPARLTLEEVELGVGGFGEVCLAILDKSSEFPKKVAVKQLRILHPSEARQRIAFRLARELQIWAKAKHPNILELIGYYLSDDFLCAQLVSPFMANGNVMQYIRRSQATLPVRLKFVLDIATGLKYLHELSPPICHGDLKPANVLVNESLDAVLCDFGVSSFMHESGATSGLTTTKSTKGSTRYMGPELVLEEVSKHTLKSDVWAWGCTAFEVMTESIPYSKKRKDSAVVLEMHKKSLPGSIDVLGDPILGTVDPACHNRLSSLRSIIPKCWDFEPARRPSSSDIFHCINIPLKVKPRLGVRKEPAAEPVSPSIQGEPSAPFSAGMCKGDEPNQPSKVNDEDDDKDTSARMRKPSGKAPSPKVRLCIVCEQPLTVGTNSFCSKACKAKLFKAGSPKTAAASPSQQREEINDSDPFEQEGARPWRRVWIYTRDGRPAPDEKPHPPATCMSCFQNPRLGGSSLCGPCSMPNGMATPEGVPQPGYPASQPSYPGSSEFQTGYPRPESMSTQNGGFPSDGKPSPPTPPNLHSEEINDTDTFEQEYTLPRRRVWIYTRDGRPAQDETPPPPATCMYCLQNPRVDGSSFCGPRCRANAMAEPGDVPQPGYPDYPTSQPYYPQTSRSAPQTPPPPPAGKPCKIMNCNGTELTPGSKYCSNNCRKAAVKQGLEVACPMCKEFPKASKMHFCDEACSKKAQKIAPFLLDVPKTDPKFADILKQFNDTWQDSNKPTVHRICKIINSKAVEDRFRAYRRKIERAGNWVAHGKKAGNENRRWLGIVRQCTVGDDPNKLDLCTRASCSLCFGLRNYFDISNVVAAVYGQGVYTSAFSSISHAYTRPATKGFPYRAMLLTRIVTGKEHIFTWGATDPNATAPPTGYDSVADCAEHSALVVFQSEAIYPAWLVLYS